MNKILAILFLLLAPLCVWAQSEDAETLYDKGMVLLKAQQYEEAIPVFQKSLDLGQDDESIQMLSSYGLFKCYAGVDNYTEAIKYGTQLLDKIKLIFDESRPLYYQTLINLAQYNGKLGNYQEAIRLDTQAMEILKKTLGEEHSDYAMVLNSLAYYYSFLDKKEEAIRLGTQAMEIRKKILGKEHPDYARSLSNLAEYYAGIGKYDEAINLCTQAMEIRKEVLGEESTDYASSMNNLGRYHSKLGHFQEAIILETQAMEIRKKKLGEDHSDYALSLSNLSAYYNEIGNYQEAMRLGTQAMEIRKKVLGENHHYYAESLSNMGGIFANLSNYQEAIKLETQASEIYKKVFGEEHSDYAYSLTNLADYYAVLGNYQEAIRLSTQAIEITKKTLGEEHPDYASRLSALALYYGNNGNLKEAKMLGTQAAMLSKKILGEENPYYAETLLNLAQIYGGLGDYNEAIRLCTQAMEIFKTIYGAESLIYASCLHYLTRFNYRLGDNKKAIRLGTQTAELIKKINGEEHPLYAASLDNLADNHYDIGNYQDALRLGTQAMEIRKKILGEEHPEYATSLDRLADVYSALGNNQEALRLITQAMEIRKKVLGEEHPGYAASLNSLADYYDALDNHQQAIKYCTQAMEINKKIFGEDNISYATNLDNLAKFNANSGNFEEAVRLGKQAMEIRKKVTGGKGSDYATSLYNLANYYYFVGNFTDAITFLNQAINILDEKSPEYVNSVEMLARLYFSIAKYDKSDKLFETAYYLKESFIMQTFSYLTYKERSDYWNTNSDFFNYFIPFMAYIQPNASSPTILGLNSLLLAKGLLLNTELEIQNLIEKQGDEQLKEMFFKIRQDGAMLDQQYRLDPDKRTMDVDSLSKVIDNEERHLILSVKELGDYTKNLLINWDDIKTKLTNKDVAVEFACIKDTSMHDVYIAFVVKKGMSHPELVKLNFASTDTADYSSPTLYNKIWKPLEKHLQGVSNVYFSPAGKFHSIGIEYLPNENNEIFAKKYNAYRLSSTRELALNHTVNPNKKASVYGGIIYNFEETDWQNVTEENSERGVESLTFLKSAKIESEDITNILSNGSFNVEYNTEKAATEESFKKLSGSGIKILHVATHGFYEPESKEKSFADMLSVGDKNSKEDFSLSRSGLFFAGANTALNPEQRQFIPEGVEDGILTAKEISRMDFNGLDLVVLSACQTGLGEVTGEGVFGLQRGFKKAGAQTIIMSLWNVNDKPTKELMTEFYRNLVAGKTKREAFILAQDKIRQKYINPKMWAGFIMVDGME